MCDKPSALILASAEYSLIKMDVVLRLAVGTKRRELQSTPMSRRSVPTCSRNQTPRVAVGPNYGARSMGDQQFAWLNSFLQLCNKPFALILVSTQLVVSLQSDTNNGEIHAMCDRQIQENSGPSGKALVVTV